jgi:uncharacterized repeat protein (TIGR01451 family)
VLGNTGNNGPATGATLSVYHLQSDRAGNLYFADPAGSMVRRIDAAGNIGAFAGDGTPGSSGDDGPAVQARIYRPLGVAIDGAGNLYIADSDTSVIRKVAAGTGIITAFAGGSGQGFSGDGNPAVQAKLNRPYGMAVGPDGSIYIADSMNHRIRKVDSAGTITTAYGNGLTGTTGGDGDGGPALLASLATPVDVAFDAAGNLFILDAGWKRLRRVDAAGNIHTHAGGGTLTAEGTPGAQFQFSLPGRGIAVDAFGNVYVADNGIGSVFVRKIDAAAPYAVTTIAGTGVAGFFGDNGPARLAQIQGSNGLEFDAQGNLYIGDFGRIRKISVPQPADLSVHKACLPNPVLVNQNFTCTITVHNRGSGAASSVQLVDTLSPVAGVTLVSASAPAGACPAAAPNLVLCTFAALAPGATASVTLVLQASQPGTYADTAAVTAAQTDPVLGNNTASFTTTVTLPYALSQFVAFGSEHLLIDRNSNLRSGAAGANTRATNNTPEVFIRGPLLLHPAFFAAGDTVLLDAAHIPEVRSREPVQLVNGAAAGTQSLAAFPLLTLPALAPASPDAQASGDIVVAAGQTRFLEPGRYRKVTVNEGGTLTLRGYRRLIAPLSTPIGYDFLDIELKNGAKLLFNEPAGNVSASLYPLGVQVRVQGRLNAVYAGVIGPAAAQGALRGSHILFHVGGVDTGATVQTFVPVVVIGPKSTVRANIYAPGGNIFLNRPMSATGAFVGKSVIADWVDFTLESAF